MKKLITTFTILLILCALSASAEEFIEIHDGFLTGNDYLKKTQQERSFYAMGIIDGMFLSPLFGASKNNLLWLERCVEGMGNYQMEAIISKYLENHPGEWHHNLHTITFRAMKEACQK